MHQAQLSDTLQLSYATEPLIGEEWDEHMLPGVYEICSWGFSEVLSVAADGGGGIAKMGLAELLGGAEFEVGCDVTGPSPPSSWSLSFCNSVRSTKL